MDERLKSYARAYVLRARPTIDPQSLDAYMTSIEFGMLVGKFETNLLPVFDGFLNRVASTGLPSITDATPALSADPLAQPMTSPTEPRTLSFAELSNTAADVASHLPKVPAALPAAPTGPAAAVTSDARPDTKPEAAPPTATSPVPTERAAAPVMPLAATRMLEAFRLDTPLASPPIQHALQPPDLPDLGFRLPNARAGTAYIQRLDGIDSHESIVFDEVHIPDGLSLTPDLQTGSLAGTPLAAGDYTIAVTYHYARESPSRRRRAVVPLSVAPDPRTMWKNLDSDRNDPYWKEDEQHSSVRGSDLSIVAASKRGRSHAHVGSFRDDDYRIEHDPASGWYVAVVADGAGSARYSRRGAALICEEAKARVLTALTSHTVDQIDKSATAMAQAQRDGLPAEHIEAWRQELHTTLSSIVGNAAYWAVKTIHDEVTRRADLDAVFKDYSSTALIAICKRYPFGTLCAAYWVGDGTIGIYSQRDGITLLGDVDSGEFSGQTRFLDNTMVAHEVLRKRIRFALVDDMTALVLMTDGVSDAKFETEARLARSADWHAFWDDIQSAVDLSSRDGDHSSRLLAWLDFWSQGNHDDRTIAIIY